jgi:GH25 family lysozyme M1 (1,4-beta-N-acetylmuramidase)
MAHALQIPLPMKKTSIGSMLVAFVSFGLVGCGSEVPGDGEQDPGGPLSALSAHPSGVDVSDWDGTVNWNSVKGNGKGFAYIKATEGTGYESPEFASQYNGSYDAGLIRGAYHFARPDISSGTTQANYFVNHGGGWSGDGKTLPGTLDIEYNPYGQTCYNLSASAMVTWVHEFANQYKARTGRDVVIYTTADWWDTCTGGSEAFGATNPLWVANYDVSTPALPKGWAFQTFWQYTSTASVPGISGQADVNVFNGNQSRLVALAK